MKETEIDVVFHDPKGFLKDAVIHYFWFINTVNYGQTPTVRYLIFQCSGYLIFYICQGHFEYNFTNPGDYDVEVTAIAYFNAGLVNPTIKPFICLHRIIFVQNYPFFHAEPNSTLEQPSLNTVGRDMGSELSLREVRHFLSPFEHHLHTHSD